MMHRWWRYGLLGLLVVIVLAGSTFGLNLKPSSSTPVTSAPVASAPQPPIYQTYEHPHSLIHVVQVPNPEQFPIHNALAATLSPVESLAQQRDAIAAINGGFFDPNNGQTTSYITRNGELIADPRQNQRLVDNPALQAYLDGILNRSEFRRYRCPDRIRYDITFHNTMLPAGCSIAMAVGAGPQLLPQDTSPLEAFTDYRSDGSLSRDALGSRSRNARSAIGLKADGTLLLVMAAQIPNHPDSGLTLADMAHFLREQGVTKALNLDGGSSATLVFQGQTHYGRLDAQGRFIRRPVKSILWVNKTQ